MGDRSVVRSKSLSGRNDSFLRESTLGGGYKPSPCDAREVRFVSVEQIRIEVGQLLPRAASLREFVHDHRDAMYLWAGEKLSDHQI
jgi:hypothetical protein